MSWLKENTGGFHVVRLREPRAIHVTLWMERLTYPAADEVGARLRAALVERLDEGFTDVVVDMRHVKQIDSRGVRVLLTALDLTSELDIHLHACHVAPVVAKMLAAMRLAHHVDVAPTLDDTLAKLRAQDDERRCQPT